MIVNCRPLDCTTKSHLNSCDCNLTKVLCKHLPLITQNLHIKRQELSKLGICWVLGKNKKMREFVVDFKGEHSGCKSKVNFKKKYIFFPIIFNFLVFYFTMFIKQNWSFSFKHEWLNLLS